MAMPLKPASVDELVKRVLGGERKLQIRLPEGSDLSGHERFSELQRYLRGQSLQDLENNPLDISGSQLVGVKAAGLYLPFVQGLETNLQGARLVGAQLGGAHLGGADLSGAYFDGARLVGADLSGAYFDGAHLGGAYFDGARLVGADLSGAYLYGAYLGGADLSGADFTKADLRGVMNLSEARGLDHATFLETVVGEAEQLIIAELAPSKVKYLVVR